MKARLLSMCLMCLLFWGWQAQVSYGTHGGWDAWLYEPETRHVWNIDDTGTELANFSLPIPDIAYSNMSRFMGVSHNGRYIAYFAQHNTAFDYRFLLYDRDTRTMFSSVYTPTAGDFQRHSLDFVGGSRVFSSDDQYLAIAMQTDATHWEIHVIDMLASPVPRIVHTLRNTDSIIGSIFIRDGFGVPVIQQVTDTSVAFTYLNSMEGTPSLANYVWEFGTGSFYASTIYANLNAELLEATGEVLVSYQNTSYPNRLSTLEYPLQYNVIEAYYPPYGNFIYYNNPDVSVEHAYFVQNGVRILIREYEYDSEQSYWLLRERSGFRLARTTPTYEYNSLAGSTNGFLITATNVVAEGRGIVLEYDTRSGTASTFASIWNAPVGEFPRLMLVNSHVPVDPSTFAVWGEHRADEIAGSPIDTSFSLTETPSSGSDRPLAAGDLVVGGRARIYTTEGDSLNVRSGPGVDFAIVGTLATETRVTVLEGPVSANGFQWWRIETDDGLTGWAVDFVDDIPTLIPE